MMYLDINYSHYTHTGRYCSGCDKEIIRCMGSIKAGDMILYWKDKLKAYLIRELCGLCVNKYKWTYENNLVLN